ncbi:MAG: hypothetical protein C4K58_00920 [Flavobacteriaceae bacterium]|nr:MAG: hypothetical protein C4K58_00920 [Flavobacteriaceae bacterium]
MKLKLIIIALILSMGTAFGQKKGDFMVSMGVSALAPTDAKLTAPRVTAPFLLGMPTSTATVVTQPSFFLYFDYMLSDHFMLNFYFLPSMFPGIGSFTPGLTLAADLDLLIGGIYPYPEIAFVGLPSQGRVFERFDGTGLNYNYIEQSHSGSPLPFAIWFTYLFGEPGNILRAGPGIGLGIPLTFSSGNTKFKDLRKDYEYADSYTNKPVRTFGSHTNELHPDFALNFVVIVNLSEKAFLDLRASYIPVTYNQVTHVQLNLAGLTGGLTSNTGEEGLMDNLNKLTYLKMEPEIVANPIFFYAGVGYNMGDVPAKAGRLIENTFRSKRRKM